VRLCSMNCKTWVTVLDLCTKRTLVLTLFVYLLAACFCDRLSLPQMDSISSDSASGQSSPGPSGQHPREAESVMTGFRDLPGCVSQNGYELDPCIQIW
jgi:hypothetical protein